MNDLLRGLNLSRTQKYVILVASIVVVMVLALYSINILAFLIFELTSSLILYEPLSINWLIIFLLLIAIIGSSLLGVYYFIKFLLVEVLAPQLGGRFGGGKARKFVELATLKYHLDDPANSEEFDTFLDSQIIEVRGYSPNHLPTKISPRSYVEQEIFSFVKYLESEHKGKGDISVRVEVKRGSLIFILTILVNAYSAVAQWEDFNLSIRRIRRQAERVVNRTSQLYNHETARNIKILSDHTIEPLEAITNNEDEKVTVSTSPNPNEPAISSVISPSINNTFNPYPSYLSPFSRTLKWAARILFFIILLIAGSYLLITNNYIHCKVLNNSNTCYEWSMNWAFQLTKLFGWIGYYFDWLAQSIMP